MRAGSLSQGSSRSEESAAVPSSSPAPTAGANSTPKESRTRRGLHRQTPEAPQLIDWHRSSLRRMEHGPTASVLPGPMAWLARCVGDKSTHQKNIVVASRLLSTADSVGVRRIAVVVRDDDL